jgi:predicted nucleic acid-binding protein
VKLDPEVFLDSAYLIALAQPGDQHHSKSREIAESMHAARIRIVTNRAVLLEIGSALSKIKFRPAAVQLVQSLECAPLVQVVPVTEELCARGWELFRGRPDKEWSWVDCISFVVMRERAIRQALTTDEHFEQAGFVALLRQ